VSWLAEHRLIVTLFAAYAGLLAWHGLQGLRQSHGVADYYVGGRRLGGVTIGMSYFATLVSANTFIGLAGQSYAYGAGWALFGAFFVAFSLVAWTAVAPRLRRFTAALGSVTLSDYVGLRFESRAARLLGGAVIVFASLLYMTAIYKGIGNLLETLLDIPYRAAVIVVLVVTMLYTAAGGFLSVVRTDVVQGVIVLIGAVILFSGVALATGGPLSVLEVRHLPEGERLFSLDAAVPFPVMLGIFVAGAGKLLVDPRQLSRFYGLADEAGVRRGMWISTSAFLVTFSLVLPLGLYARLLLPPGIEDTDLVIPSVLAAGVFPEALAACLVIGIAAAAMSSLDSVLLVTATTFQRDVIGSFRAVSDDLAAMRLTRWLVAAFAVVTGVIALDPPGGIVKMTTFAGSLYAACFVPAVLLGLHWRRGNGSAVLASYAAGVGVLALWPSTPWSAGLHEVFPAVTASVTAYGLLAVALPPSLPAALAGEFAGRA